MPLLNQDSIFARLLAAFGLEAAELEQRVTEHLERVGPLTVAGEVCDALGLSREHLADLVTALAEDRLPEFFERLDLPVVGGRIERNLEKNRIIPAILSQLEAEVARFKRA